MSYIKRAPISQKGKDMVWNIAQYTQNDGNGNLISPNGTGKKIDHSNANMGHPNGMENHHEIEFSESAGITQKQHNQIFGNPCTFQLEPSDENKSHLYECKEHNEGMQNVTAYAASQNRELAENIFINPSGNGRGTISVQNQETGEFVTLSTYDCPGNSNIEGVDLDSGNDLDDCYSDYNGSNEDTNANVSAEFEADAVADYQ